MIRGCVKVGPAQFQDICAKQKSTDLQKSFPLHLSGYLQLDVMNNSAEEEENNINKLVLKGSINELNMRRS